MMKQLIRYILKEETSLKRRLKSMIKDIGVHETSKVVGGYNRLSNMKLYDDPMDYLDIYNDLNKEEGKRFVTYKDNKGFNVFYVDKKQNILYVSAKRIYDPLELMFDIKTDSKKADIIKDWVMNSYGINVDEVWYDPYIQAVTKDDY